MHILCTLYDHSNTSIDKFHALQRFSDFRGNIESDLSPPKIELGGGFFYENVRNMRLLGVYQHQNVLYIMLTAEKNNFQNLKISSEIALVPPQGLDFLSFQ